MIIGRLLTISRTVSPSLIKAAKMSSSSLPSMYSKFETLAVSRVSDFVYKVELNRPKKRNAMNGPMWREIEECFNALNTDQDVRCVILRGRGEHFCAGIDIFDFRASFEVIAEEPDIGRRAVKIGEMVKAYQRNLAAIDKCRKPVIAAVHGHCIGGAIDMISGADVRYCTADANFHIKEVEIGLAPDTGTIQRMMKAVGNISMFREMVLTGKQFGSDAALQMGMVSRVFADEAIMMQGVEALASLIASRSPVAVQTSKESLNYSRDHSVADGLNHIAILNMAMLQSEDLVKAAMAAFQKETPEFAKL